MFKMKNDKSSVSESKSDNRENKSNSYTKIYENDSGSVKEIKMKWNERIDEIKNKRK